MKGCVANIEKLSLENLDLRKIPYTDKNNQSVSMSLLARKEINEKTLRVNSCTWKKTRPGHLCNIPTIINTLLIIVLAGTKCNVINNCDSEMKFYNLYMPLYYCDEVVRKIKME